MIKIFGSNKIHALANFYSINDIRKEAINASIIVILDDAVEEVENISSLTNFIKKVTGAEIIFLYEKEHYVVYAPLFDAAYRVPIYAIDDNTISQLVRDGLGKHTLLTKLQSYLDKDDAIKDIDASIPKVLPNERHELVEIINQLSDSILSLQASLRYSTVELDKRNKQLNGLYLYTNNVVKQLSAYSDTIFQLSEENLALKKFKDNVQMYMTPTIQLQYQHKFKSEDIIYVHIKELDDMLYTKEFLRLLLTRISNRLGMPTKCYFLTDNVNRATRMGHYQITDMYATSKLESSSFVTKIGYSAKFFNDIEDDHSNPKCVIIFNAIQGVDFTAPNITNYYACRDNPSNYQIKEDMYDFTITNFPNMRMSYSYNEEYKILKANRLTRNALVNLLVFNVIEEHVAGIQLKMRDSKVKAILDTEV